MEENKLPTDDVKRWEESGADALHSLEEGQVSEPRGSSGGRSSRKPQVMIDLNMDVDGDTQSNEFQSPDKSMPSEEGVRAVEDRPPKESGQEQEILSCGAQTGHACSCKQQIVVLEACIKQLLQSTIEPDAAKQILENLAKEQRKATTMAAGATMLVADEHEKSSRLLVITLSAQLAEYRATEQIMLSALRRPTGSESREQLLKQVLRRLQSRPGNSEGGFAIDPKLLSSPPVGKGSDLRLNLFPGAPEGPVPEPERVLKASRDGETLDSARDGWGERVPAASGERWMWMQGSRDAGTMAAGSGGTGVRGGLGEQPAPPQLVDAVNWQGQSNPSAGAAAPVFSINPSPVAAGGIGRKVNVRGKRRCPDCMMMIAAAAADCAHCGHMFRPSKWNKQRASMLSLGTTSAGGVAGGSVDDGRRRGQGHATGNGADMAVESSMGRAVPNGTLGNLLSEKGTSAGSWMQNPQEQWNRHLQMSECQVADRQQLADKQHLLSSASSFLTALGGAGQRPKDDAQATALAASAIKLAQQQQRKDMGRLRTCDELHENDNGSGPALGLRLQMGLPEKKSGLSIDRKPTGMQEQSTSLLGRRLDEPRKKLEDSGPHIKSFTLFPTLG